MIIRSQNKKVICNFGTGCTIANLGKNDDGEYLFCMSYGQGDYDLGRYNTEDEAIRVLENIYAAMKAGDPFYEMPDASKKTRAED